MAVSLLTWNMNSRGSALAYISLHFGLFGPSFPCILAFWGSASGPPHKLPKTVRFPNVPYKEFISARPGSILQFLALWAFISLAFGLIGPAFPCLLAFWALISCHFGVLGLHFLAFWAFGAFISLHFGFLGLDFLAFWAFGGQLVGPPPISCQKMPACPISRTKNLAAPGLAPFCNF